MSEAKAPSAHEAKQTKHAEPSAHPASPEREIAVPAGVALLDRVSATAAPSLPAEALHRTPAASRGLGPTPISFLLHAQRRHGNRQTMHALTARRAAAETQGAPEAVPAEPELEQTVELNGRAPGLTAAASPPDDRNANGHGRPVARLTLLRQAAPSAPAGIDAVIQRETCPAPPPPTKMLPSQDPKFVAVKGSVGKLAKQEKQHAPASAKASEAQNAAVGPANEVASKAAEKQVDQMGAQQPGAFDKKAFVEAVKAAIAKIAPKNQSEAADFKSDGKAGQIKGEVTGHVSKGKETAANPIKQTAEAAPNPAGIAPKPVTPMPKEEPGGQPPPIPAAKGMPAPRPPDQVSLAHGPCETSSALADAGVTEKQLDKSNEPAFKQASDAKKKVDAHAATAPKQVRAAEQAELGKASSAATSTASKSTAAMHQHRTGVLNTVQTGKGDAKAKDEAKRAEVSAKIESIYAATKTEVGAILAGLDDKVNKSFDAGEQQARSAFERHVDGRMRAYKDERYDGISGAAQWLADKFTGLPPEVNAFYTEGRDIYIQRMDGVINTVAGIVERELTAAKARVAKGKKEISDYVKALPKNLQAVGKQAQADIQGKFDELDQDINAKQDELVQGLAQKYAEARDAVDARIGEMQAENKGLVDAAMGAIKSVIETIKNLKNMLLNVLARAAAAIEKIIDDPIGFLSNLISAIKQGFFQFKEKIFDHLKAGLMGWLLGELAAAGIRMPKSLDFMGILDLVLQVMGLTYDAIRARAVKLVGEQTVSRIEKVAEVFKVLITEGPAGLWKWVMAKVDNLVDLVLGGIQKLVVTQVIEAGIKWIIGLLNPASAFVKACMLIYDVIMFFVERGSQIMELVNAIIDSVESIASGAIGAAANWIEKSLAKALPVVISFLASLLGLGGLSEKIKKIIDMVRQPVGKAVDAIINTVVKAYKKVSGFVGGLLGKGKDKEKGDDRNSTQKEEAEKRAAKEGEKLLKSPDATPDSVRKGLPGIKTSFNLTTIDLVKLGDKRYQVQTAVQRAASDPVELSGSSELPPEFEIRINFAGVQQRKWPSRRLPGMLRDVGNEGQLNNPKLAGAEIEFYGESEIGEAQQRPGKDARSQLPAPGRVGMGRGSNQPHQIAHGFGPGFGKEMWFVSYAPQDFNLKLQNARIEDQIRAAYKDLPADTKLIIGVQMVTHPGTMRLRSITYKVMVRGPADTRPKLHGEIELTVSGSLDNPNYGFSADLYGDYAAALRESVLPPLRGSFAQAAAEDKGSQELPEFAPAG